MTSNGDECFGEISLANFVVSEIIKTDVSSKRVCFLGHYSDKSDERVLIEIEPVCFNSQLVMDIGKTETNFAISVSNPPYFNFCGKICSPTAVTGRCIRPVTDFEIERHRAAEYILITETPEIYLKRTFPYIESHLDNLQWVYNILDGSAEKETVVYRDQDPENGFVICHDLNWSGTCNKTTHLLVLVNRKDIRTLRNLDETKLPLLEHIRDVSLNIMTEKFKADRREVRMYVHYLPSYFHFHVHVNRIDYFSRGTHVGKAHLLDDVIGNIRISDGEYYKKSTIGYTIQKTHDLAHEQETN